MSLNREQIIAAVDVERELVPVLEWGGEVWVKGLTGTERDAFETSIVQQRGQNTRINTENMRAKLAALTICDENGTRLFSEKDVATLGKKSATALNRVFVVAQRLSGIGAEAIKDLTGGLEDNPLEDSPSD